MNNISTTREALKFKMLKTSFIKSNSIKMKKMLKDKTYTMNSIFRFEIIVNSCSSPRKVVDMEFQLQGYITNLKQYLNNQEKKYNDELKKK